MQARFGTAGFNTLRGPGVFNMDLGLFREFRLMERMKLQFRAEGFNATNTPHFANPYANASAMALNPDGSIASLNGPDLALRLDAERRAAQATDVTVYDSSGRVLSLSSGQSSPLPAQPPAGRVLPGEL